MLRRVAGTLVLLAATLLLNNCELTPGSPPGPAAGSAPIETSSMNQPSPASFEPFATVVSSPLPGGGDTVALVPSLTPQPTSEPGQPAPTPGPTLVEIPATDLEAIIVAATNEYRQEHGCSPVSVHAQLTLAAQSHAEDMAAHDFFSHVSLDGRTLADRVTAVRYRYRLVGENLAAGYSTAVEVVDSWMRSEEHRNNILNCEFEDIGVGYVFLPDDPGRETWQHYWVQVFGVK